MEIAYKKLQNGSDIRGVAMEGIEGQPVTLTNEAVTNIAKAFVLYLQETFHKSELRLSIGRDSRLSGERLMKAAADRSPTCRKSAPPANICSRWSTTSSISPRSRRARWN